jgi:hypothetical protein
MRNSHKGRFRVWDRSQDSFNGEDLVYNFDAIDELIGGANGSPGSSTSTGYSGTPATWLGYGDVIPSSAATKYPGTKNSGYEAQQGRRTLYSVVSGLNYNDVPLGTVIAWWRPASTIAIPDGWVPCDGRQVEQADHSFPIPSAIILPDLRNKFVLGADETVAGINAVNGYTLAANAQSAQNQENTSRQSGGAAMASGTTGAPGAGYDSGLETSLSKSGSNIIRNISHSHGAGTLEIKDHAHAIDHTHVVPPHRHYLGPHSHGMDHVHMMAQHQHDFRITNSFFSGQARISTTDGSDAFNEITEGQTKNKSRPASRNHVHKIDMNGAGQTGGRRPYAADPSSPSFADANAALFGMKTSNPQLWGYSNVYNPDNLRSGMGYGYASVTSSPTSRIIDVANSTINAHTVKLSTDNYGNTATFTDQRLDTGLNGSTSAGDITTGGASNDSRSGNITGASAAVIADSKKLLGTTTNESIYVNIRPQSVGLVYLMKVKVATNLI